MAKQVQLRLTVIEARTPPQLSRALLQCLRNFCIKHDQCEFTHVKTKRPPRDAKMRGDHQRALETLRMIANATGKPGVANFMRRLARDTLRDIT
jgi:hypothetical protein